MAEAPRSAVACASLVSGLLAWSGSAQAEPPPEPQKAEIRDQIRKYWRYREAKNDRENGASGGAIYFVSPGAIFSFEGGSLAWFGAELSATLFPWNKKRDFWAWETTWLGFGGFAQAQLDRGASAGRLALGGQVVYGPLGVELGAALRGGADGQATAFALHAAGFLSLGGAFVALRLDDPLTSPGKGAVPEQTRSVVLGIKLPIFNNHVPKSTAVPGRGLTIERREVVACLRQGRGWG